MKYLILAAGKGTRMGPYGETLPKVMLKFAGYPLIMHHIAYAGVVNADKIILVKGYKENLLNFTVVKHYINEDFENTNMVESFMVAREEFDDDIIVAYGDIIYDPEILRGLVETEGDFVVTVDDNWRNYWKMRFGALNEDLESLRMYGGNITEIGLKALSSKQIEARYVGLMKFSVKGLKAMTDIYDEEPELWKTAYMTDLLQELIDREQTVKAYKIQNRWLEFDSAKDYEKAQKWREEGILKEKLNLKV